MFDRCPSPRMTCEILHQEVVDHAAEIVCRAAVAAQNHRIADLGGLDFDPAENEIGESHCPGPHAQSQRTGHSGLELRIDLVRGEVAALSGIDRCFAAIQLLFADLLQFLFGTEAPEGLVFIQQPLRVFLINIIPVALPVRAECPLLADPFIPFESQPEKIVPELFFVFRLAPLRVRVFDPQNEGPVVMPRQEPVEQRRPDIPHV